MSFKIGLCQIGESLQKDMKDNKEETWRVAEARIREAAANGAQIVALPEMWNCPYSGNHFREYAEEVIIGEDGRPCMVNEHDNASAAADNAEGRGAGESGACESGAECSGSPANLTAARMSSLAAELGIYLVGGSISELEADNVYNTCLIFDREGKLIGKHRKAHMFDVDIKGGTSFRESDTLTAGSKATTFETEYGIMGAAICYDIRFPEFFRKMELEGAKLIFLPAAFTMKTGSAHWDLIMRARAMDNQCYLAAISPARVEGARYRAYGHSCVCGPWGEMIVQSGTEEDIIYAEVDPEHVDSIREQMPILEHRKPEMY